jgi:hypothetical protein
LYCIPPARKEHSKPYQHTHLFNGLSVVLVVFPQFLIYRSSLLTKWISNQISQWLSCFTSRDHKFTDMINRKHENRQRPPYQKRKPGWKQFHSHSVISFIFQFDEADVFTNLPKVTLYFFQRLLCNTPANGPLLPSRNHFNVHKLLL